MSKALSFPSAGISADLDQLSWQAVCDWPNYSATDVVKEGLDYGVLARYFLWDKVPRAIRYQVAPDEFELEADLLRRYQLRQAQQSTTSLSEPSLSLWERQIQQPFNRLVRIASLRVDGFGRSMIFVPRQHGQLRSTVAALRSQKSLRLVAPDEPGNIEIRTFQVAPKRPPDLAFVNQLYEGIITGLKAFGIELLTVDLQTLRRQLTAQANLVRQVEAELTAMQPQAVLVFADNHMPSQEYVAIANREGIPTIMLQHGLDCELYCLDDAYASVVAVWGEARKQRYEKNSEQRPTLIQVTGNPRYDDLRLPEQLCPGGDRWLWVTRPHGPEKCLLPSRSPKEGLEILAAILAALKHNKSAHLTIKPHPFDYSDLYLLEIEKGGMGDRVTITRDPLDDLMPQFDVVISEDSTAAMEAMFYGKIVVHAHFAASPPALPLVDYAAALPANNSERLQASLREIKELTSPQKDRLFQGQRNFIRDYAGPLDGKASQRVSALIHQTIARKH